MFRIKELRESRQINMREAARLLNMPYTTYVNYEKGFREPTSEILIQIADFYGVTVDYLLGRTQNVQIVTNLVTADRSIDANVRAVPNSPIDLTPEEISLIRKYRCLDDRGQASVRSILEHEYNSLPGEKAFPHSKKA